MSPLIILFTKPVNYFGGDLVNSKEGNYSKNGTQIYQEARGETHQGVGISRKGNGETNSLGSGYEDLASKGSR